MRTQRCAMFLHQRKLSAASHKLRFQQLHSRRCTLYVSHECDANRSCGFSANACPVTKNASMTACGAPIRDRAPGHTAAVTPLVVLTFIAVAIRFGFKIFVSKSDLGSDDWTILAAMLCCIPSLVVTEAGTIPNGLGKDIWTLRPSQITSFAYYFWIMAWIYFLEIALNKLSIVFFYLRIFPTRSAQRILWGTVGFIIMYGTAFVIACICQCRPISYGWRRYVNEEEGHCVNISALTWSNAVMGIALDLWLLAVPLWQIRSLHMSLKKKIGVGVMFFVGTLCVLLLFC
jgi:hypothetical protein